MKNCRTKRNKIKRLLLAGVLSMGLIGTAGCGQTEAEHTEEGRRYIAVICKGSQHEFWKTVEQGARDAGEELNIKISFEAPEDESQIDKQIDMVEKAICNKADAIVLAPLDTDKLNESIDKAVRQGIPVLTFDSDVTTEARVATIGTDNRSAGAIAARNAAELMGGSGKAAIISYVEGAQTAIERNEGFCDEIENTYRGKIEIVGLTYCNGDVETAKEQALDFLDKYPDLKCIYGANEGSAVGAAEAIAERKLEDRVSVIGFDSSDAEISYLESGAIDGMMVQNPYNMGYLGVRNVNKVLDGRDIEDKFNTGAAYVNRDNLYDEYTQWLLYPLGNAGD